MYFIMLNVIAIIEDVTFLVVPPNYTSSLLPIIYASGHKHTLVTCENKVSLGQKHYQVAWGKLIGDQN